MKTALIVGSTGMVGKLLTHQLIEDPRYQKIRILVRKKIDNNHPKLEQIIFDFNLPDPKMVNADDVFCCLGTTIKKAGSKNNFKKVDFEYPLMVAKFAKQNGVKQFAIITAMGANQKSKIFYNSVKGDIEESLKKIEFDSLLIFRPSMLLGKREEFRMGEIIGSIFMKMFSFAIPSKYKAVQGEKVAQSMIYFSNQNKQGVTIVESDMIFNKNIF
ncbi:MAG: oxidoreductase [Bacteroidota bacterium]